MAVAFPHKSDLDYRQWRQEYLDAEHDLKVCGLVQSDLDPHRASPHPDVRYSLDRA